MGLVPRNLPPVPPPNILMREGSHRERPVPFPDAEDDVEYDCGWKLRPLDDTAARFAAIPWFIVWLITLGAFGKPLFCASGMKLPTRAPDPSMKPPPPPAPPAREYIPWRPGDPYFSDVFRRREP